MQVNASSIVVEPRPLVFAGLPATSWLFAIRIWIVVILAPYVSFWLELEAPTSAVITVAILALPTRGQAMEKAGFRLVATVIGVAASIALQASSHKPMASCWPSSAPRSGSAFMRQECSTATAPTLQRSAASPSPTTPTRRLGSTTALLDQCVPRLRTQSWLYDWQGAADYALGA